MEWTYLIALIISIAGMTTIDWRHKLAFWHDKKRTLITLGIAMGVFVVWDILGISLGIFLHGNSQLALPFRLLPEFPIEELFFLLLLCYSTLVIYTGVLKVWPRT